MPLTWQDSYKIGHAEIDAQHKGLFEAINDVLTAQGRDGQLLSTSILLRLTMRHFEFEEALMRSYAYPAIAGHFKAHTDLISKLTQYSEQVASDSIEKTELERVLSDWLRNHISTSDAKLVAYMQEHRTD